MGSLTLRLDEQTEALLTHAESEASDQLSDEEYKCRGLPRFDSSRLHLGL